MDQLSPEWFAARKGRITASQGGGLLGLSTFVSPTVARRDWLNEHHGNRMAWDSPDAARGRRLENAIIERYEEEHDTLVHSDSGAPYEDWLWASPDGLVDDGMVEIKAPREFHVEPYPQYEIQFLIQLTVYGRGWVDWVQGVEGPAGLEIRTRRFTYGDLLAKYPTALDDLKALWLDMLDAPAPAPVEGREDAEWLAAEAAYSEAKAAEDDASALLNTAKAALLTLAEGKPTKGRFWQVSEATRSGTVDLAKLQTDNPGIDVDSYRKEPTTHLSIRAMPKEKA